MDYNLPNVICILTFKEQLGFDWEVEIQQVLQSLSIPFVGNPQNSSDWKTEGCGNNKPKQHRPDIETSNLQIECKWVGHKFYPSYLQGNVYPRFKDNGKMRVVLTNNKDLWSPEAIEGLNKNNIELWSIADLKDYYINPTFTSIYNYIKRDYGNCTYVVRHNILYLYTITLNLIRNAINPISQALFGDKKLLLDDLSAHRKNDTPNPKTESDKKKRQYPQCRNKIGFIHLRTMCPKRSVTKQHTLRFLFILSNGLNFNS